MIKVKKGGKKNKISPLTTEFKRLPRPSVSPMQYKPLESKESDHVVVDVKPSSDVELKF